MSHVYPILQGKNQQLMRCHSRGHIHARIAEGGPKIESKKTFCLRFIEPQEGMGWLGKLKKGTMFIREGAFKIAFTIY